MASSQRPKSEKYQDLENKLRNANLRLIGITTELAEQLAHKASVETIELLERQEEIAKRERERAQALMDLNKLFMSEFGVAKSKASDRPAPESFTFFDDEIARSDNSPEIHWVYDRVDIEEKLITSRELRSRLALERAIDAAENEKEEPTSPAPLTSTEESKVEPTPTASAPLQSDQGIHHFFGGGLSSENTSSTNTDSAELPNKSSLKSPKQK